MKTVAFRGIHFAVIILMLVTCASSPKTRFSIDEVAGTKWFNEEYPPSSGTDLAEITTDGMMKFYSSLLTNEPPWIGKFTIIENWYDEKGDLWFKSTWENKDVGPIAYFLCKISKSGTVWESCWSASGYPSELSPIEGEYSIYYRK